MDDSKVSTCTSCTTCKYYNLSLYETTYLHCKLFKGMMMPTEGICNYYRKDLATADYIKDIVEIQELLYKVSGYRKI